MNKASLVLSIVALLGVGFVFNMNTNQSKIIAEQNASIEELHSASRKLDDRMQALLELGESFKSGSEEGSDKSKSKRAQKRKMYGGYYCLVGSKSDNSVLYFDSVDRMKTWGDADGTISFQKTEPDASGRYAITGDEIIMSLNDHIEKNKFTRRGNILSTDEDGKVLEISVLGQLFSYKRCPFKK